eukprot:GHVT01102029.1.p1 GENE.GHVT01102029.1~~GHVT01102029.1.p1  ORF type:complete len:583 (-),score=167.81 GHVT01102029.1:122-1870(-)
MAAGGNEISAPETFGAAPRPETLAPFASEFAACAFSSHCSSSSSSSSSCSSSPSCSSSSSCSSSDSSCCCVPIALSSGGLSEWLVRQQLFLCAKIRLQAARRRRRAAAAALGPRAQVASWAPPAVLPPSNFRPSPLRPSPGLGAKRRGSSSCGFPPSASSSKHTPARRQRGRSSSLQQPPRLRDAPRSRSSQEKKQRETEIESNGGDRASQSNPDRRPSAAPFSASSSALKRNLTRIEKAMTQVVAPEGFADCHVIRAFKRLESIRRALQWRSYRLLQQLNQIFYIENQGLRLRSVRGYSLPPFSSLACASLVVEEEVCACVCYAVILLTRLACYLDSWLISEFAGVGSSFSWIRLRGAARVIIPMASGGDPPPSPRYTSSLSSGALSGGSSRPRSPPPCSNAPPNAWAAPASLGPFSLSLTGLSSALYSAEAAAPLGAAASADGNGWLPLFSRGIADRQKFIAGVKLLQATVEAFLQETTRSGPGATPLPLPLAQAANTNANANSQPQHAPLLENLETIIAHSLWGMPKPNASCRHTVKLHNRFGILGQKTQEKNGKEKGKKKLNLPDEMQVAERQKKSDV